MLLPYSAAILLIGIGLAHSILGERYVLQRLGRLENLPRLRLGGRELMMEVLRFAWHITTLTWFGIAGILILIAHDQLNNHSASAIIAGTFIFSGVISLIAARGKHYSWLVFFAIGAITGIMALT
ncbi:MAG: hypothetical protein Tsb002_30130 [Wenzhouxiangellaceae bacterium]